MAVRNVHISDEQLLLFQRSIRIALGYGVYPRFTDEERHELDLLLGVIKDTVESPDDPNLLHGFCL